MWLRIDNLRRADNEGNDRRRATTSELAPRATIAPSVCCSIPFRQTTPQVVPTVSSSSNSTIQFNNSTEPEQLLGLWRSLDSGASNTSVSGTGKRNMIPPTTASKSKDITSYVTLHPGQQGEDVLKVVDGHITVGQKKTPREKLSIAQYMEGALRMADTLPPTERNAYYGYITRIAQMAQMFSWQSVLLFDREFRREQDEKQWPWSTEAAYLMTLCLRAHTTAPNPQAQARAKKQAKIDPNSSKPVCIRKKIGHLRVRVMQICACVHAMFR